MARYRRPWWVHCQYQVVVPTPEGVKPIHCTRGRSEAVRLAREWNASAGGWRATPGMMPPASVALGPGHKTVRGF